MSLDCGRKQEFWEKMHKCKSMSLDVGLNYVSFHLTITAYLIVFIKRVSKKKKKRVNMEAPGMLTCL